MWNEATKWEKSWWGSCANTFGEQEKQLLYAEKMGLEFYHNGKSPYNIDVRDKSIIDIGGGPTSLLLKCVGFKKAVVVDPIRFPRWVLERYKSAGIEFGQWKGEEDNNSGFDEAWIYNVLQHTQDPKRIIGQAQSAATVIRLFEWIDTPTNVGHIHTLTEDKLNGWLSGYGKVENVRQANCFGKAYYGVFPSEV